MEQVLARETPWGEPWRLVSQVHLSSLLVERSLAWTELSRRALLPAWAGACSPLVSGAMLEPLAPWSAAQSPSRIDLPCRLGVLPLGLVLPPVEELPVASAG